MFRIAQIAVGGFDDNFSYFISAENGDSAVVDPCGDVSKIAAEIRRHPDAVPKYILITHDHHDHVSGLRELLKVFPAAVVTHPASRIRADIRLRDRQRLPFGVSGIECLFSPGHSDDSVCYLLGDKSAIFTGDTLFIGCCGYCDPAKMFHTMRKVISPLPDSLTVYPGHDYGDFPYDSLGVQKRKNPCLYTVDFSAFCEEMRKL